MRKRAVCAIFFLTDFRADKRDKREQRYCNPGIDRSDFAGRQLRRAGYGAKCPGGRWRSADQRHDSSTGKLDPRKHFR